MRYLHPYIRTHNFEKHVYFLAKRIKKTYEKVLWLPVCLKHLTINNKKTRIPIWILKITAQLLNLTSNFQTHHNVCDFFKYAYT